MGIIVKLFSVKTDVGMYHCRASADFHNQKATRMMAVGYDDFDYDKIAPALMLQYFYHHHQELLVKFSPGKVEHVYNRLLVLCCGSPSTHGTILAGLGET